MFITGQQFYSGACQGRGTWPNGEIVARRLKTDYPVIQISILICIWRCSTIAPSSRGRASKRSHRALVCRPRTEAADETVVAQLTAAMYMLRNISMHLSSLLEAHIESFRLRRGISKGKDAFNLVELRRICGIEWKKVR